MMWSSIVLLFKSRVLHRRFRHWVTQQLALAYDRRQIILERSELADKLAGQYVEVYDFTDRPLEVRWKGHSLPYRVFSKDQRVSHTAIVENKRLSHVRTPNRCPSEQIVETVVMMVTPMLTLMFAYQ
jgi:hypothetical protein